MRFIEKTLPVEQLNPVALAEGNAKKPIYQIHKWWARRLGSVFRMITFSSFHEDSVHEKEIWRKFCEGANLEGKIILDPFMGGGTTVVEANRLGCKVIGVDINPVAWFVTKKEIEPVDLRKLDAAFKQLEETAGKFIKQYYSTRCPKGHEAEVMYFFWVKVAECPSCGFPVKLFTNYELSHRNHINVVFCPECLQIIEANRSDDRVRCKECGNVFNPRNGVSGKGVFRCPKCKAEHEILEVVERRGTRLDVELHALEGYCKICGRFFKRVDEFDVALWEKAKADFERHKENLLFPRQAIPVEGRSDPRPVNHGYLYFWEMFNERQLLCLSKLLEEILKIPDQNIREFMLLAFSDCLDANNMFCKYEVDWHKISVFFGLHAYHPIERPTENNPWGTLYGRCTFTKCFEKVKRGKEYCLKPYERLVKEGNKRFSKRTGPERIEASLVETFEELIQTERAALLRCQTAEDLSFIPDKSVDVVITDPPYFDNVQYSELADFFYVWLRLGLKDIYPWFEPEYSGRPEEIIQNEKLGKTTEFFSQGLRRLFGECHRVLKDEGLLIFTFHHNKLWAWESIGQILLDTGFYISATPVVRSEGKSGFHSSRGNIRYDCVPVCRKRPSLWEDGSWSSIKERILSDAIIWARRTLFNMPLNEVDIFTIIMGKTLEYYTKAFPDVRGSKGFITLEEALQEMKNFADHVAEQARHIPEKELYPKPYAQQAKQLALFVLESREKYKVRRTPLDRREGHPESSAY